MTPVPCNSVDASRFVRLALDCLGREYPNHPLTIMFDEGDVRPPHEHTPAFFGCFDWHSAVHGHWTLVRLLRCFPEADWHSEARSALQHSLTPAHLAAEVRHLGKAGREGFERPYGLAWLLQLAAELRAWDDTDAGGFVQALQPLERLCRDRLADWLPKLTHPIRTGEHSQTAFAMGLALDWSEVAGDEHFAAIVVDCAHRFYSRDTDLPLRWEPSGHDFLSPALAEADLMRRVLSDRFDAETDFSAWLTQALPDLGKVTLSPVVPSDRIDGKLAHLDGLNLSRAWMLRAIAAALPNGDPRTQAILESFDRHAAAGLAAVTGEHYAGGHWLGTFATYLETSPQLAGPAGGIS